MKGKFVDLFQALNSRSVPTCNLLDLNRKSLRINLQFQCARVISILQKWNNFGLQSMGTLLVTLFKTRASFHDGCFAEVFPKLDNYWKSTLGSSNNNIFCSNDFSCYRICLYFICLGLKVALYFDPSSELFPSTHQYFGMLLFQNLKVICAIV